MFKNFVKITFRNLVRHKAFSAINISGLALGMACCLTISLWVMDELSYDKFNEKSDRIYKVTEIQHYTEYDYKVEVTPAPIGPELKEKYPEIVDAARFTYAGEMLLRYGDNAYYENGVVTADPSFFYMFTYPAIRGNAETALEDPNSLVITEEYAKKYFEDEDPIGKVIQINNKYDFTVGAVIKDVPDNSHLMFDVVLPWTYMKNYYWYRENAWGSNSFRTFVLLDENAVEEEVEAKIIGIIKEHNTRSVTDVYLQPLLDIHLHSAFYSRSGPGDIMFVYVFSIIAIFVLIIACINFMNLSTARSGGRAKEIGMRKVVGALKSHLIKQFYGESLFLAIVSLFFAVILVFLVLPFFGEVSGKELSLNLSGNWQLLLGMLAVTLFTGLVAGSYPAIYLSSFRPVNILRGSLASGAKGSSFRKVLVITQFTLSIILIIGTGIVNNQLMFMQNLSLGWDKEHLVYIRLREGTNDKYESFKSELKKNPDIVNVTAAQYKPTSFGSNTSSINWEGKDPEATLLARYNTLDYDYLETLKIEMAQGRAFSRDFKADTTSSFIVNETLARIIGRDDIIGSDLTFQGRKGTIVGVMKDFHFHSARMEIEPLVMRMSSPRFSFVLVKIAGRNTTETLNFIEGTWNNLVPNYPLDYNFIDEDFNALYRYESRLVKLLSAFSMLAIVIACLGLFGLASYTAEQRTKEMGIRKVLGATGQNIIVIMSTEFVKLVVISNILAWPVAYFVTDRLLEMFAYKADVGISVFLISGFSALAIALLTVTYQTIRTARANPVNSLKYE